MSRSIRTVNSTTRSSPASWAWAPMASSPTARLWTKTCGPWFYYLNDVPADVTDAKQAAHLLYQDALAQADAEAKAWPYAWFKHPGYVPASGRGTVKGRIVINDPGNPNASAAGTWVGLEQQPQTIKGFYDFQKWLKPYQFWVQADKDGNFTVPNVIAGANYTLWAYGPGAAGTFLSQEQAGGKPPLEYTLPAKPFAVNVTAGQTSDLGTIDLDAQARRCDRLRAGHPEPQSRTSSATATISGLPPPRRRSGSRRRSGAGRWSSRSISPMA